MTSDQLFLEIIDVRAGTNGKVRAGTIRAAPFKGFSINLADIVQIDLVSILDSQFLIRLQGLMVVELTVDVRLNVRLIYFRNLHNCLSRIKYRHRFRNIHFLDRAILVQLGTVII